MVIRSIQLLNDFNIHYINYEIKLIIVYSINSSIYLPQ